jgi:hypothetical protein
MDAGLRTPLVEAFRRGEVPRDIRLQAARGELAPRGVEQLALLMLLSADDDEEVRDTAAHTLQTLPADAVAATIARAEATAEMVRFFGGRGVTPLPGAPDGDAPVIDTGGPSEWDTAESDPPAAAADDASQTITQQIQQMNITQRVRAAMKGTREMRAILVRDPNKLVSAAVLSSPKLTLGEVEAFAKMANVGEDVLRTIAMNRAWVKHYPVVAGLTRNPKTPVALSLNLLPRLVDRDVKAIASDRNVPEPLRISARKKVVDSQR